MPLPFENEPKLDKEGNEIPLTREERGLPPVPVDGKIVYSIVQDGKCVILPCPQ
jgi:hypothetical protein